MGADAHALRLHGHGGGGRGGATAGSRPVIPLVTPSEMGAADARTIAAGTPERTLMDRAGRAVAWRVRAVLGGTYGRRVVVICGKGNNGGDGLVAADVLRAWGVAVEVRPPRRSAGARGSAHRGAGPRRSGRRRDVRDGFRGALDGTAARDLAEAVDAAGVAVVAVDIPSGVDGLTGEVRGAAVRADHTVTFAAPKPGLLVPPGSRADGHAARRRHRHRPRPRSPADRDRRGRRRRVVGPGASR